MRAMSGSSVTVIVLFLAVTTVWGQEEAEKPPDKPSEKPPEKQTEKPSEKPPEQPGNEVEPLRQGGDPDADEAANNFIVPKSLEEDVDSFKLYNLEYIVTSKKRNFKFAKLECEIEYHGQLAILDTDEKADFMAEALSETNLEFDSVWIGGRATNQTDWLWLDDKNERPISQTVVDKFKKVDVVATDRNCLAFSRDTHDKPSYRPLACNSLRAIMCERPPGGGDGNSTHPGWIRIFDRLFKIFSYPVTYEQASSRCYKFDPDARLAYLPSEPDICLLSRYLLIGRPSLENAWISGRWSDSRHMYVTEDGEVYANESSVVDHTRLNPPWKYRAIRKTGGCILLDRHKSYDYFFIEARCDRERPYICFKYVQNKSRDDHTADVIIDNDGYRLHFIEKTWRGARDYCENAYKNYGSYLSEILAEKDKYNLLYVMGENRSAVQHIWLGGKFEMGKWQWDHSKQDIPIGPNAVLNWVNNSSFVADVESENTCLDMDRENHIGPLHYGTSCKALQYFVCYFTKEQLIKLQEAEKKWDMNRKSFRGGGYCHDY